MKTAIAKFEKYLKRRYPKRSTAKHYISDLMIFHQFAGQKKPREITAKTIDAFIEAQQANGLKASTINRRLATLSSFFDFLSLEADADDWLNPVRWKRHRVKQGHHLPRDASEETVKNLMAVLDDQRDRAIFSLMLKAGLRVGEVVALNAADLEAPVSGSLARLRVSGKGGKERMVWLTLETWLEVQAWLKIRPESKEEALFLNQHRRRLSVAGVQYRLKGYTKEAGITLSCHQLRHTYARRLAEREMPLDSLAKLMGHNSLQTTQLYIDGANPALRRDFQRAMQGLESAPAPDETPVVAVPSPFTPRLKDKEPDNNAILKELAYLSAALPNWLQEAIRKHMLRRMPRWAAHQRRTHSYTHLNVLRRLCGWLVETQNWQSLPDLRRQDLLAYVDHRLDKGVKASSINSELAVFHGFWRELLEREQVSNGALLLVKAPSSAKSLPRYLKAEDLQRLLEALHSQTAQNLPRDYFDRSWFYLLLHAGLRVGEVSNLRLSDCDLRQRRLLIRAGKGDRDRIVPMSDTLLKTLQAYLPVRQTVSDDHLLIYRGVPAKPTLITARLRRLGSKADLKPLSPHRLRHTLATLLVNQGMPITSLQKLLGHQDINTTLIYAKVFDETVRQQFAAAMAEVEGIAVCDWPTPSAAISVEQICDSV